MTGLLDEGCAPVCSCASLGSTGGRGLGRDDGDHCRDGLRAPLSPVCWSSSVVGHGNNLDCVVFDAVDQAVGIPLQHVPTRLSVI